jgi:hypothetical protein
MNDTFSLEYFASSETQRLLFAEAQFDRSILNVSFYR